MSETNYERYFGTPEKAAALIEKVCFGAYSCSYCALDGACPYQGGKEWREWLESEAE